MNKSIELRRSISILEIDALIPYARNSRTHSEAQIAQIAGSIREFGFTNPVLIDDQGGIIAGHGRVLAARKLGLKEVPCIVLTGLTDTQRRAYVIADNRLAETSGWDLEMLAAEIEELRLDDFNIDLVGFDQEALDEMFNSFGEEENEEGLTDPDEVPEPPPEPISKPGDIWVMGRHRLMCGDSTDADMVARLMNGEKADLCFTSPPYGQQRDYIEAKEKVLDWDGLMRGVFLNLPMTEQGQVLVNLGLIHRDGEWVPYWDAWIEWMREQGWRRFGWYVWDQGSGLPGDWNGRLGPSHEFVFHFNKQSSRPQKWVDCDPRNVAVGERATAKRKAGKQVLSLRGNDGEVKPLSSTKRNAKKIPDSVIRISRCATIDMARENHPATFPIQFAAFGLKSWLGTTYEPFSGSGTTIIAAEQTGRRCYAMELSPQYVDVAVKRWQDFTGKQAIHAETGDPFPYQPDTA